jgi:decaprenylphospho-beta-D-ribofuranose 2-oxidase
LYDKEYNYSVAWVDSLAKGKRIGSGVLTLGNPATIVDLPDELKLEPLKISGDPRLSVPVFFPDFALNQFTVHILNKVIGFVQNSPKALVHYEKFFFPLDAINNWNKGYGKRGFIQYQFVIPEKDGRENLLKILTKITKSGCSPFLNVLKKMGKGQGILSFPFEGYTLAIDFPVTKRLIPFTRELDQHVLEAGGRIYLGKDALLTKEMFQMMYPQHKEWLNIKKKYDPENVFTSNISRRLGLES